MNRNTHGLGVFGFEIVELAGHFFGLFENLEFFIAQVHKVAETLFGLVEGNAEALDLHGVLIAFGCRLLKRTFERKSVGLELLFSIGDAEPETLFGFRFFFRDDLECFFATRFERRVLRRDGVSQSRLVRFAKLGDIDLASLAKFLETRLSFGYLFGVSVSVATSAGRGRNLILNNLIKLKNDIYDLNYC